MEPKGCNKTAERGGKRGYEKISISPAGRCHSLVSTVVLLCPRTLGTPFITLLFLPA